MSSARRQAASRRFGAVGSQQCLEPEAAAVALFGVGPAVEELFDERGRVRSGPLAPGDQSGRSPTRMRAVRGGHVRPFGRVSASPVDPKVGSDPAVLVEDLHGLGRDPNVDLAAAQRVGDAVERVLDLDVVVDVDPRLAPLGVLVALGRKRLECWPVQILEPAAAAPIGLLERPLVQRGQQRRDGVAEFAEREELMVAQRRHDPALDVLDCGFRLGLVPRCPGPRRQHRGSVVGGQFLVRRVQVRLVAAGLVDRRLLVVRDHEFRHPAPELEHPDVRHRPVRQRPAPGHVHEGVVRRAEDTDEDHDVPRLAGLPVHDLELRARVVHERLLARPVHLPHDHVDTSPPRPVALAEPAVPVAVRVGRDVLQPQQLQRHPLVALKLPVNLLPVRLRPGNPRRRQGREQRRLQHGVVQPLRQWPCEAGRGRPPRVIAHRAVGDAERRGDLAVAAPKLVLQP